MEFLSNEGVNALGDKLRSSLSEGDRLSIISSYFTVFAFGELKDELSRIDELRFLFDEPTFVEQMTDLKDPREFVISQRGRERGVGGTGLELTLRNNLNQRALAHECAEWVRSKATFRSARSRGVVQSGSVYHVAHADGSADGFQGFNLPFTLEGLGYERKAGVVGGYGSYSGTSEAQGLKAMFDGIWDNPSMVADVSEEVAAQIGTLYRENAPEFVYFLTLYHVFRDFMESMEETDPIKPGLSFTDSVVWNKLYDFQRDAVVGAIRKLERYKGCIIADSVGLDKTFEALAVIKYYQERNDRVLVLAPKRLRENWTLYTGNDERNPLVDERLNYDVLNHTDLSRYTGFSGDINLETIRWGNYDLIVIDESHNFRNKPTDRTQHSRYDRLMNYDIHWNPVRIIRHAALPQSDLLAYATALCDHTAKAAAIPAIGAYPHCKDADTPQLMALLSRLRDAQAGVSSLQSRYRNKGATLAETSRLRIKLRKAERVREGIASEIKELIHE